MTCRSTLRGYFIKVTLSGKQEGSWRDGYGQQQYSDRLWGSVGTKGTKMCQEYPPHHYTTNNGLNGWYNQEHESFLQSSSEEAAGVVVCCFSPSASSLDVCIQRSSPGWNRWLLLPSDQPKALTSDINGTFSPRELLLTGHFPFFSFFPQTILQKFQ